MGRSTKYGERCKADVAFVHKPSGFRHSIFPSPGKERQWLRVKINGKLWHVGRLVAWAFCNPRGVKWSTFGQKQGKRGYKYQALHLSLDETDFTSRNLLVGTKNANLAQYRSEAKQKYNQVYKP